MKEILYAAFVAFVGYLLLPKKAGLAGIRNWAHRASASILALFILFGASAAWALGLFPGLPGFVQESRAIALEKRADANDATLKVLARTTLRPDIYALRQLQCKATDDRVKVSLTIEMHRDMDDYRDRVGQDIILPSCSEF